MAAADRLEAKGPRGEACIIIRTRSGLGKSNLGARSDDPGVPSYRLGTGERLKPTGDAGVFETTDGKRQFTLR